MKTSDFYYDLPPELIAQTPVEPRDSSRLLVYHRDTGAVEHKIFRDVIDYLNPGDVLVINQTRVIPARLYGVKEGTGGAIEFLLLRRLNLTDWEVILKPGKKAKPGARFVFGNGELVAEILTISEDGGRTVRFFYEGVFEDVLDRLGQMPLPPYIHEKLEDKTRYQTVYAKVDGSAAAPTAGLHFTPALLEKIRQKGVDVVPVLLHVGLGTFRPVKEDDVADHHMHSEYYEVTPEQAQQIGMEFARKMWGKRFQVVVTTHLNTKHLHCHFVINSVSFVDGKRLKDKEKSWYYFRHIADEICLEHKLSIVEKPELHRSPSYLTMKDEAGMPTRYNLSLIHI